MMHIVKVTITVGIHGPEDENAESLKTRASDFVMGIIREHSKSHPGTSTNSNPERDPDAVEVETIQ